MSQSQYISNHTGAEIDTATSWVLNKKEEINTFFTKVENNQEIDSLLLDFRTQRGYNINGPGRTVAIKTNELGQVTQLTPYDIVPIYSNILNLYSYWEQLKEDGHVHGLIFIMNAKSEDFYRVKTFVHNDGGETPDYYVVITKNSSNSYTGSFVVKETENNADHYYEVKIYQENIDALHQNTIIKCEQIY